MSFTSRGLLARVVEIPVAEAWIDPASWEVCRSREVIIHGLAGTTSAHNRSARVRMLDRDTEHELRELSAIFATALPDFKLSMMYRLRRRQIEERTHLNESNISFLATRAHRCPSHGIAVRAFGRAVMGSATRTHRIVVKE